MLDEEAFVQSIPKIELHLHLDGSLSSEFIGAEAAKIGLELPDTIPNLRSWLQSLKLAAYQKNDNSVEKGKNWGIFDFCNQFLQTEDQLSTATLDLAQRLADKNVIYSEIRFCPSLHTQKDLNSEQALQAVIKGFNQQNSVLGGIIVCALRSKDANHCLEMAELAGKYLQKTKNDPIGVVGFDVAGDEGSYPLSSYESSMVPGIQRAQNLGVPITIHAGEWPEKFNSLSNVKFAIEQLKVQRIGHAITLRSDLDYLKNLSTKNAVTIEVCLTSNIGNGFKVKNYEEHPVILFNQFNIPFNFCMDNWLLSGDKSHEVDPNNELIQASKLIGWKGVKNALINGAKGAFSPVIDENWIKGYEKRLCDIFAKKGLEN